MQHKYKQELERAQQSQAEISEIGVFMITLLSIQIELGLYVLFHQIIFHSIYRWSPQQNKLEERREQK